METRVCKICEVEKNLNKDNYKITYVKKSGGLSYLKICRECDNKISLKKKMNFEFDYSNVNYNLKKKCTKCNNTYNLKFFTKDKRRKDGFTSHCNDCRNLKTQKYYKENIHIINF